MRTRWFVSPLIFSFLKNVLNKCHAWLIWLWVIYRFGPRVSDFPSALIRMNAIRSRELLRSDLIPSFKVPDTHEKGCKPHHILRHCMDYQSNSNESLRNFKKNWTLYWRELTLMFIDIFLINLLFSQQRTRRGRWLRASSSTRRGRRKTSLS